MNYGIKILTDESNRLKKEIAENTLKLDKTNNNSIFKVSLLIKKDNLTDIYKILNILDVD